MLLLKQNTTRKGWVNKKVRQIEFEAGDNDNKKYKVKAIRDSVIYARELEIKPSTWSLLSGLMERISRGREYLRANFSNSTSQKAHQLILHGLS